jgi:hypothetical protein
MRANRLVGMPDSDRNLGGRGNTLPPPGERLWVLRQTKSFCVARLMKIETGSSASFASFAALAVLAFLVSAASMASFAAASAPNFDFASADRSRPPTLLPHSG